MAKKEVKTNVMRILDQKKIPYSMHAYDPEDGQIDAESVALKCGQHPEQVFKTLVTEANNHAHYVFVVPANAQLDLKACARAAGVRSVEMIPQKQLLPLTGYIHGGCSPIGMKKPFMTFMDETAVLFDTIFVSGGRVGTQIEINPEQLRTLIGAEYAPIAREK